MMRRVIGVAVLTVALVASPAAAKFSDPKSELRIAKSEFSGVAPCRFEDGSGQAPGCVWDARHRGNGIGRSFIVTRVGDRETFTYVTHRQAHRLVAAYLAARCTP